MIMKKYCLIILTIAIVNILFLILSYKILDLSSNFKLELANNCSNVTFKTLEDFFETNLAQEDQLVQPEDIKVLEILNLKKFGKVTIFSISNYGFANMTLNWIISLKKSNFNNFVVLII